VFVDCHDFFTNSFDVNDSNCLAVSCPVLLAACPGVLDACSRCCWNTCRYELKRSIELVAVRGGTARLECHTQMKICYLYKQVLVFRENWSVFWENHHVRGIHTHTKAHQIHSTTYNTSLTTSSERDLTPFISLCSPDLSLVSHLSNSNNGSI
jgi:hypothetical protein